MSCLLQTELLRNILPGIILQSEDHVCWWNVNAQIQDLSTAEPVSTEYMYCRPHTEHINPSAADTRLSCVNTIVAEVLTTYILLLLAEGFNNSSLGKTDRKYKCFYMKYQHNKV